MIHGEVLVSEREYKPHTPLIFAGKIRNILDFGYSFNDRTNEKCFKALRQLKLEKFVSSLDYDVRGKGKLTLI